MIEPYPRRVYHPCCGSSACSCSRSGSSAPTRAGTGTAARRRPTSASTGRSRTTRRGGLPLELGHPRHGGPGSPTTTDSTTTSNPDLKADFILANPRSTSRNGAASGWRATSAGSTARRPRAAPTSRGRSTWCTTWRRTALRGFVLANGSMSSSQSGEGEIRKNLIVADLSTAWSRSRASSSARRRFPPASGCWPAAACATAKCSKRWAEAIAWNVREDGDFGGDTGASAWCKHFVHKRLATTETPA